MAYTATITMNSGEQFTATSITYRADSGKLEFTGTTGLTTRTNHGCRQDSATAGAAVMDQVASITVA
jgi:hypothetical protein